MCCLFIPSVDGDGDSSSVSGIISNRNSGGFNKGKHGEGSVSVDISSDERVTMVVMVAREVVVRLLLNGGSGGIAAAETVVRISSVQRGSAGTRDQDALLLGGRISAITSQVPPRAFLSPGEEALRRPPKAEELIRGR